MHTIITTKHQSNIVYYIYEASYIKHIMYHIFSIHTPSTHTVAPDTAPACKRTNADGVAVALAHAKTTLSPVQFACKGANGLLK